MKHTVFPKKYARGFVVLCFVVVMQSFIINSHEVFIHIHQGCFAGTGAIVRLPQCQWSKPDGYGKISQCITTTKHSKAKTVCIFLGIYCICSCKLWQHWFRQYIVVWSEPHHYMNQWLFIRPLETYLYEILIKVQQFPYMNMHVKMLFGIWQPFCLVIMTFLRVTAWML